MRYNKIRKMDISNGPGVRVSIFMQGCTFNCKNCFNPETHDFCAGKEFTDETIDRIMELCSMEYIEGLSILGGDPLEKENISKVKYIIRECKLFYEFTYDKPLNIWLWTGSIFENLLIRLLSDSTWFCLDSWYIDDFTVNED